MSNFAAFTLAGILQSAGWPKKSGFLGRNLIVNAKALDLAVDQLLKIGVALGVGRSDLALRLIAFSFERDWTPSSARELVDFLNVDHIVAKQPDQPLWRLLPSPRFSEMGKANIPYDWLGKPELTVHHTGWFAQALLWGVLHKREGSIALDEDRASMRDLAGFWRDQGLSVSPDTWPSSNDEEFGVCEELVHTFEAERSSIPEAPIALLQEPRIVRALV